MNESAIVDRITRSLVAAKRPEALFKALFFDVKEKAKDYIADQSVRIIKELEKQMKIDLTKKGLTGSLDIKLGKFKGHPYVSTAKLIVKGKEPYVDKDDSKVKSLLGYLQKKYSPKFKVKSIKNGIVTFNVR